MTEVSKSADNQTPDTVQIVCPKCGEPFTLDGSGYASILKQVHNHEFDIEIKKQLDLLRENSEAQVELVRQQLQARIDSAEIEKQLAVTNATVNIEKERDALRSEIELQKERSTSKELSVKAELEVELKEKDLEIARLREYKLRMSTKGIGEDLEKFCETEFNKIRAVAFPRAQFGKDNVTVEGGKGDYIFREFTEDGIEIISIMFEMKNESEDTAEANRQKNEKFYKKLDSDRKKKNCEYAVLVSALELDNELFNEGIVDVSHEAEKMYVVRPGFFIPIIALLRNAAMSNVADKREIALIRAQNVDVENFKDKLDGYKKQFDRNMGFATSNIDDAIEDIEKTIKKLQDLREHLVKSADYIQKAYGNLDDVSITKLTARNPTMKKMFDDLERTVDGEIDDESPLELEN